MPDDRRRRHICEDGPQQCTELEGIYSEVETFGDGDIRPKEERRDSDTDCAENASYQRFSIGICRAKQDVPIVSIKNITGTKSHLA